MSIASAIDNAKKLQVASKGSPLNAGQVASILGHNSAASGAFLTKIADLRAYGILEGRGDQVKTSQIADILTHPKGNAELSQAVEQLARKIPLFNELLDRLGNGPYDDDAIALQLVTISGLPRAQVAEHVEHIGKVIREVISRSKSDVKPTGPSLGDVLHGRGLPTLRLGEAPGAQGSQNMTDGTQASAPPAGPMGVTLELRVGPHKESRTGPYTESGITGLKAYLQFLLDDKSFWEMVKIETPPKPATPGFKKADGSASGEKQT
jgi:hypothetical protein